MVDLFCLTDEIAWIPTDEELPESRWLVLFWVTDSTPDNRGGGYVGWYSNEIYDGKQGRWFDIFWRPVYADVTHWTAFPRGPDCTLRLGVDFHDIRFLEG